MKYPCYGNAITNEDCIMDIPIPLKNKYYSHMKKYVLGLAIIGFGLQGFSQDVNKGKTVYAKTCVACHQANGAGIPGAFPPLAKADYLNKDVNRAIKQVIHGSKEPITVNGKKYTTPMPAQALNDQQVADVLTYVYANWGNNKSKVTPAMVKAQREKK